MMTNPQTTTANKTVLLYSAAGRLHQLAADGSSRELVSQFIEDYRKRTLEHSQRNAWKRRGGGMLPGGTLWNQQDDGGVDPFIAITGMAPGNSPDEIYYVLHTSIFGGLFHYRFSENYERRLFHRETFRPQGIAYHPGQQKLVCALDGGGTQNLAVMEADGAGLKYLTEGDSHDGAPSWVPGERLAVVYESAGIGRNQAGHFIALGPSAIHEIDLETREITSLLENEQYDYLQPRITATGELLCIRRPYQPPQHKVPLGQALLGFLLLPFRIAMVFFGILNTLSMIFTQKPLTMAGGMKQQGPPLDQLWIKGRLIEAKEKLKLGKDKEPAALVPNDWVLLRRKSDGTEEVLANAVASYDLDQQGNLLYTNGRVIFQRTPAGEISKLYKGELVQEVVAL